MPCTGFGAVLKAVHFVAKFELFPFQLGNLERVFGWMKLGSLDFLFQMLVATLQFSEVIFDGHEMTSSMTSASSVCHRFGTVQEKKNHNFQPD